MRRHGGTWQRFGNTCAAGRAVVVFELFMPFQTRTYRQRPETVRGYITGRLAELDYLLATRVGQAARSSRFGEVERGAYVRAPIARADVGRARAIIARHADLAVILADASIVVLAERHRAREILTLDQRHFRVLRVGRRPFRVLPADAS
jgi:uncharacterized protein